MYNKLMTEQVFERFHRAAEAFAHIYSMSDDWLECKILSFYERFADDFSYESCYTPDRFTVVYRVGTAWDGNLNAVLTRSCEKTNVRLTDKYIEFEDGRRVHRSDIFFFVY